MSYLTRADIPDRLIDLNVEPECDVAPEEMFDSGEPELDAAEAAQIRARLYRGDDWAWCAIQVVIEWHGFRGESSFLGGCSYEDEHDYRKNSGYFDDQVDEAIDDLNLAIRRAESPEAVIA